MSTIQPPGISGPDIDMDPIPAGVRIGHIHLKVSDLERALRFYCGVLGFQLTQRHGSEAAFVSAGRYHHHIGLNTWESRGGSPPRRKNTGLYHFAILYPSRGALANALRRLMRANVPLAGAADHGVSEALYVRDPDENGIELYWDRPAGLWPRGPDSRLAMSTRQLDLQDLLKEGMCTVPDREERAATQQSKSAYLETALDNALADTFPASDPVAIYVDEDR